MLEKTRDAFPGGLIALLALVLLGNQHAFAVETIQATSSSDPIKLDGRLDEPGWQTATPVQLTQQNPRPGASTPYQTEIRILRYGDRLYFGFTCHDPKPAGIRVHTLQRDGDVTGDDTVTIVLDPYLDRKTGYFFQVNAAGARIDGLISSATTTSLDWDGVWDARTSRSQDGWSAEVEIPARTLSFSERDAWGVNFERFIARDIITMRWASPTLDSSLADLSRAGLLSGIRDFDPGRGLEFIPYIAGRLTDAFPVRNRAWQGASGFDVNWRIAPHLTNSVTVNTDFAETEVDARQVNLTRFPLFFPEKRAFFLEGINQFAFGLGLTSNETARYGIGSAFIPFFTRRVGLDSNGRPVPIDFGTKLSGRAGRWNLAALDVQTRDTSTTPKANLFAGRVSRDVTDQLRIGGIVTNGDPQKFTSNTLAGIDAVYRSSKFMRDKNLLIGTWTAKSFGQLPLSNGASWGAAAQYPNDTVDCEMNVHQFGASLIPALGFLPRPGTRWYQGGCEFRKRPSKEGRFRWIRQEALENYFSRISNLNGFNESWRYFVSPVSTNFESGEHIEINLAFQHELLVAPFEIVRGLRIAPGSYDFRRVRFMLQSSKHRGWQLGSTHWLGTFYSGDLHEWTAYLKWDSPGARVQTALTLADNFGHLREGNFVQRLWQYQFTFAWNPQIGVSSFIQYDNQSRNVGSNTRFRWTIRPGNDFYVIWNRSWNDILTADHLSLLPNDQLLAIKLHWTFRR
jgi:hypothetical protein